MTNQKFHKRDLGTKLESLKDATYDKSKVSWKGSGHEFEVTHRRNLWQIKSLTKGVWERNWNYLQDQLLTNQKFHKRDLGTKLKLFTKATCDKSKVS